MSDGNRAFLSGARSRLLPLSVPMRYFGSAAAFHLLAWFALMAGAHDVPHFAGGLGWPLVALHLVTLGVLAMTAIGASLQLMPVATRQPIMARRGPALIWWVYTPGVAATSIGMGFAWTSVLAAGAVLVAVALAVYAVLLARNLAGARGMPGIVTHGWIAAISLVATIVTALALALAYVGIPLIARGTALALHVALAAYGFMGMLSLGLSYILVPMFALSSAPDTRWTLASCALAGVALALTAGAELTADGTPVRVFAILLAFPAVAIHLALMARSLRMGMRRTLGPSFVLVRIAWVLLVASLVLALALALDAPLPRLSTLFGVVLVAGWLLTFLLGILQRITPFLAAMHAVGGGRRPPTPSTLTAEGPLRIHVACHVAALTLLATAVLFDSGAIATAAALAGAVGAGAYGVFFLVLCRRMAAHARRPDATSAP